MIHRLHGNNPFKEKSKKTLKPWIPNCLLLFVVVVFDCGYTCKEMDHGCCCSGIVCLFAGCGQQSCQFRRWMKLTHYYYLLHPVVAQKSFFLLSQEEEEEEEEEENNNMSCA